MQSTIYHSLVYLTWCSTEHTPCLWRPTSHAGYAWKLFIYFLYSVVTNLQTSLIRCQICQKSIFIVHRLKLNRRHRLLQFLANRMIGYWHHTVVSLPVCLWRCASLWRSGSVQRIKCCTMTFLGRHFLFTYLAVCIVQTQHTAKNRTAGSSFCFFKIIIT